MRRLLTLTQGQLNRLHEVHASVKSIADHTVNVELAIVAKRLDNIIVSLEDNNSEN